MHLFIAVMFKIVGALALIYARHCFRQMIKEYREEHSKNAKKAKRQRGDGTPKLKNLILWDAFVTPLEMIGRLLFGVALIVWLVCSFWTFVAAAAALLVLYFGIMAVLFWIDVIQEKKPTTKHHH